MIEASKRARRPVWVRRYLGRFSAMTPIFSLPLLALGTGIGIVGLILIIIVVVVLVRVL
jgi:hypothetical protein